MRAITKTHASPGIEVRDREPPALRPGDVLVRVEAVGICGSDVHIYEWTPGYEFLARYFPLTLGHEFSGVVEEVSVEAQEHFRPGQEVTSETGKVCGECFFCRQGKRILCSERAGYGRIGLEREGAMAEYVAVPAQCLHFLPEGVSHEEAAMTEPAAVALGAVKRAERAPGDAAVILGPGPIGLLILQMAKALGFERVLVTGQDSDAARLALARELGADETLVGSGEAALRRVSEWTAGMGAGVVFDATGSPAAAASGLQMLRKGGDLVLAGIYPGPIPFDATHHLVRQMKTIRGSYGGAPQDWDEVLALVAAKRVNLRPLVSEILPLEEARAGFERLCRKEAVKVLLKPRAQHPKS